MSLSRSEAVIELGKQLVAQLKLEDDLLSSWMAHYIAEQIDTARSAPDELRASAQKECAGRILELWRHRDSLPGLARPLRDLEPVLRTLASLDVARSEPRYYSQALRDAAEEGEGVEQECKKWLDTATGLDYSARLLIQFAFRSASQAAVSSGAKWVDLARQAGGDAEAEGRVIDFLGRTDREDSADEGAALKDKLARLESFIAAAGSVAAELRNRLESETGAEGGQVVERDEPED